MTAKWLTWLVTWLTWLVRKLWHDWHESWHNWLIHTHMELWRTLTAGQEYRAHMETYKWRGRAAQPSSKCRTSYTCAQSRARHRCAPRVSESWVMSHIWIIMVSDIVYCARSRSRHYCAHGVDQSCHESRHTYGSSWWHTSFMCAQTRTCHPCAPRVSQSWVTSHKWVVMMAYIVYVCTNSCLPIVVRLERVSHESCHSYE